MASVNARLRQLRLAAAPAISLRNMAERLGMTHEGYRWYESEKGFKQRYLPMELAEQIAAILADHGVDPDQVLLLAGANLSDSNRALSKQQEQLLDRFDQMTPAQRRLFLQLADQIGLHPEVPKSTEGATLHEPSLSFHPHELA